MPYSNLLKYLIPCNGTEHAALLRIKRARPLRGKMRHPRYTWATTTVRALSAVAVGSVAFVFVPAAHATLINFSSTVDFTDSISQTSITSTGLNAALTVGGPATVITDFIEVTVSSGAWGPSTSALTATFTFTSPSPSGTTIDSGSITGGQVNGSTSSRSGSLTITWPSQPPEFDFTDGTQLEVILGGLSATCSGTNNCLAGQYSLPASFLVLNGPSGVPTTPNSVPEPASLAIFGAGLAALGLMLRKHKAS